MEKRRGKLANDLESSELHTKLMFKLKTYNDEAEIEGDD